MHLSRHTDYVLRVLLYLTVRPSERCTLNDVASYYKISLEHLRKVIHELGKAGYINTYQGKGGGFDLAKDPEKINVGHIVRHFEGRTPLINCTGLGCRLGPGCALKCALDQAMDAFYDTLGDFTVADLAKQRGMHRKLKGR